jgi:hypothetical protein
MGKIMVARILIKLLSKGRIVGLLSALDGFLSIRLNMTR